MANLIGKVNPAMASKTPTWADQWDNLDSQDDDDKNKKTSGSSGKKMTEVKAAASAGLDKAKVAATVSTQKVKSGTSAGMKWVKNQYQKFSSK
ncbi:hypothetical protein HS088_TW22G00130 [Tripterygium wilfordii]|uniref:Uncharacterized protein n=1 Tax=Tripterygium wilfordii TaxID=458696 RepID=A0A7J7BX55_TRIWF|nr:hypothetical protein HS088_TW22G00130 [Tripterygium wilfordii]